MLVNENAEVHGTKQDIQLRLLQVCSGHYIARIVVLPDFVGEIFLFEGAVEPCTEVLSQDSRFRFRQSACFSLSEFSPGTPSTKLLASSPRPELHSPRPSSPALSGPTVLSH